MAKLTELRSKRTGKRVRLPERMVAAAKKNGFVVVGEEEPVPEQEPVQTPEAEVSEDEEVEDTESKTVAELRALLAERGLPTSGNKAELVARLQE